MAEIYNTGLAPSNSVSITLVAVSGTVAEPLAPTIEITTDSTGRWEAELPTQSVTNGEYQTSGTFWVITEPTNPSGAPVTVYVSIPDNTVGSNVGSLPAVTLPSGGVNVITSSGAYASLSGTNVFTAPNTFNDPIAVGTPTLAGQAATKSYVDTHGLLSRVSYAPSVLASDAVTGTTPTALDTTNLTISFVAPASGDVLVRLSGRVATATAGDSAIWCLLDHTAHTLVGVLLPVNDYTQLIECSAAQLITGLSPGTTYQYDWAMAAGASVAVTLYVQGATTVATGTSIGSPATMEVWAA
jgi:hypothetical protein